MPRYDDVQATTPKRMRKISRSRTWQHCCEHASLSSRHAHSFAGARIRTRSSAYGVCWCACVRTWVCVRDEILYSLLQLSSSALYHSCVYRNVRVASSTSVSSSLFFPLVTNSRSSVFVSSFTLSFAMVSFERGARHDHPPAKRGAPSRRVSLGSPL